MTKRLVLASCVVGIRGVAASTVLPASAPAQAGAVCTMPQDLGYSPGALAEHQGQIYQCVHVFGENLTPRGVAWVKVSRLTNVFVPQVK